MRLGGGEKDSRKEAMIVGVTTSVPSKAKMRMEQKQEGKESGIILAILI